MQKYSTYKEARLFSRGLGFKNCQSWKNYSKNGDKPPVIPSRPDTVYKDEWVSWVDWLAFEKLDFFQSREFSQSLGLKSSQEWFSFMKGRRDLNIPYDPSQFYKDKGWVNWADWLGHGRGYNQNARVHDFNQDYFDTWSSNMAYVLGLWWADGYISNQYSFGITLHKSDIDLLYEVAVDMGNRDLVKSTHGRNIANLSVNSKNIVGSILRLGGDYRKSLSLKLPYLPDEYFFDFVRGYFDGDGSIYYAKNDKAYYASITCGSYDFLKELEDRLKVYIPNFTCYTCKRTRDMYINGKTYPNIFSAEMKMNARTTKRFGEFLYSSSGELRLDRKYSKFQKIGVVKIANKDKVFLSFVEARERVREIAEVTSSTSWAKFCSSGGRPENIPSNLSRYYRNEWISWSNFCNIPVISL